MKQVVVCLLTALLLSTGAWAADTDRADVLRAVERFFTPRIGSSGQYMRNGCEAPADYGAWKNVQRCDYTTTQMKITVSTTAYLIFPDAQRIAKWVVNACETAKKNLWSCAGRLSDRIWNASNAQFPVAGYVVEKPQDKSWKYQDRPYCMLFKDGVTVATSTWETQAHVNNQCGPLSELSKPIEKAFVYARIASTTRDNYVAAGGIEPVGTEDARSPEWAIVAGNAFREALSSDSNFLLYAVVAGGFSKCDVNVLDQTATRPDGC
jgi:hypothetical protein